MATRPPHPHPRRRLALRIVGGLLAALVLLVLVGYLALRHALPAGEPGPAAEALAHAVERSVDRDAWDATGAVRWTFAGRNHHVWDRARSFDRVQSGDLDVRLDIARRAGVAVRAGRTLAGAERRAALDHAYAMWANDSFWLNPVVKVFDPGTARARVTMPDGATALRVHYASGGVTPGDTYLWIVGADGRPRACRMWVSVLPVPGLEVSWQGWVRLATGAWIATEHAMGPLKVRITDVAGAATLGELVAGGDPFAALAGNAGE